MNKISFFQLNVMGKSVIGGKKLNNSKYFDYFIVCKMQRQKLVYFLYVRLSLYLNYYYYYFYLKKKPEVQYT